MAQAELNSLVTAWKKEAGLLRGRYGLDALASICETHASELSQAIARHDVEHLTLKDASALSGYSTSHLRALISDGTLTNAGRKGSPRLLRGELPRKGSPSPEPPAGRGISARRFNAAATADAVVRRMRGEQHAGRTNAGDERNNTHLKGQTNEQAQAFTRRGR